MTISNTNRDAVLTSRSSDAKELATFLEYARPEVTRLDGEAATFLMLAIVRLRSIAGKDATADARKH